MYNLGAQHRLKGRMEVNGFKGSPLHAYPKWNLTFEGEVWRSMRAHMTVRNAARMAQQRQHFAL